MSKRWQLPEPAPESFRQTFPEMNRTLLRLLWNRGLREKEAIDTFLAPDWDRDSFDPALFKNMKAAVARTFAALEAGEVITVHGDYDADGVCGSAVLISTLRELCRAFSFDEKTITSFIPDREKDGYGMSPATVEHLHLHEKTRLIITVDCGISNKPAIDRGKELGIDTIVCDHHTMPAELPESAILIHPLVPGETYPSKTLCGTGVAFKMACGLIEEARQRASNGAPAAAIPSSLLRPSGFAPGDGSPVLRPHSAPNAFVEGYEKWLLDLVAIATVTDVMPLTGENRALESFGLKVLNKTKRVGLKKLIEVAGGTLGALDTYTIGFQIGPRINAAGRMRHASAALNVLLEEDPLRAEVLVGELNDANIDRQKASEAMYKEAVAQVGDPGEQKLVVAVGDGWPAGLVGLERALAGRELVPTLRTDGEIPLGDANWELVDAMAKLAPFGEGNPKPAFVTTGLTVSGVATMGADGKHLRLTVTSPDGKMAKMVGFGFGEWAQKLRLGNRFDAAYEVGVNEWNGNKELQLRIVDLRV
ncbi:hypothetical protein EBS80_00455 [bacterium]|nr:hypothetical protein [bacterium]